MAFGIHRIRVDLAAFKQAIGPGVGRRITEYLFAFRGKVAELYGGLKTGRIYPRPKPLTGTYQASAPGEPPAIASGRLFRSMSQPRLISPFVGRVVIDTPYAAILEGLEPSDRMEPRPFVKPALDAVSERFNSVGDLF